MKPRLCRSFARAFTSTHPLALSSASPRKVPFARPPSPPWNPSFFTVKSTLFSSCYRSDAPLSRHGVALAHLSLSPISQCGDMDRWLCSAPFPFGKGGFGVIAIADCYPCGTEATLSFSAGPLCSSFPLKPAPFCKLSAGLGSTNKSAISLPFFSSPTLALSLPLCSLLRLSFYLKLSGTCGKNCFLFPPLPQVHNPLSEHPKASVFVEG